MDFVWLAAAAAFFGAAYLSVRLLTSLQGEG